jgi:hypothetical protein
VGSSGGETARSSARSRLRADSRIAEALPCALDGRGGLPSAVSAKSPRVRLRASTQRPGTRSRSQGLPVGVGRLPKDAPRELRTRFEEGYSARASEIGPLAASPWSQAATDPGRGSSTGGVHGLHRPGASDNPAVLPDAGGSNGCGESLASREDRCTICGTTSDLTLDHILPQALGGPDSPENCRFLCRRCNSVKGPRIVSDDALRSYRVFERLVRRMGLSLKPPPLGCIGPAPILNRLVERPAGMFGV